MKRKTPRPGQFPFEQIEGAAGASDANSGGGAGSGIPSGDTALRAGRRVTLGSVDEDKKRLFPERFGSGAEKKQQPRHAAQRSRAGKRRRRRSV